MKLEYLFIYNTKSRKEKNSDNIIDFSGTFIWTIKQV